VQAIHLGAAPQTTNVTAASRGFSAARARAMCVVKSICSKEHLCANHSTHSHSRLEAFFFGNTRTCAGVFSMVLECVPEEVAQEVSSLSCFEQTFFLRLFQGRNRILKSGFRVRTPAHIPHPTPLLPAGGRWGDGDGDGDAHMRHGDC
jgi:hypothetical protein